jgi:hypothetical protein
MPQLGNVPNKKGKSQEKSIGFEMRERHLCECQAVDHKLVGNCISCGKIICAKEGLGPCLFCGVEYKGIYPTHRVYSQCLVSF